MDQLIPLINKLQDAFSAVGQIPFDLPQITVVGSQSSGKSSVIESIVGRDFLPRGSGIVTRRPLILQLIFAPKSADTPSSREEYGEFLHLPGQIFYDFNEIRNEIQRETDRVTGKNKGISNKPINLKICSPYVLNLSMVDLPGITKVATGDQPHDIEDQIRSMCYEYIKNPNAIILAVSAANQDLANSDGLKMAQAVDPEGERTVGILTKVDIMDQGTDCADILANKVIPLRRGYIAVVLRSQKDIQDNIPIRNGLEKEQRFFQTHPKYRLFLSKCGVPNLSRALNQILIQHIRYCLPEIKTRINTLLNEVQGNIDALGEPMDASNPRLGQILLNILSIYSENINHAIEWNGSSNFQNAVTRELFGGARIAHVFTEIFGKRLMNFDALEGLSDEDIRTAMANANGPRQALLVSLQAFDVLVRIQIKKLEHPGLQCLEYIIEEMRRIASDSMTAELNRFPDLKNVVSDIVNKHLQNCVGPTRNRISEYIEIELAYINIAHPDFVGGRQAAAMAYENRKRQQQQQQQQLQQASPAGPTTIIPSSALSASTETIGASSTSIAAMSQPVPDRNSKKIVVMSNGANPPVPSSVGPQADGKGFLGLFKPVAERQKIDASPVRPPGQLSEFTTPIDIPQTVTVRDRYSYHESMAASAESSGLIVLPPVPDRMRSGPNPSEREMYVTVSSYLSVLQDDCRVETDVIKMLITSYVEIVKKSYMDRVPKIIMHSLVNAFKNNLHTDLVCKIFRENYYTELMKETDDISIKRKENKLLRDILFKSLNIVNEVRDYNMWK